MDFSKPTMPSSRVKTAQLIPRKLEIPPEFFDGRNEAVRETRLWILYGLETDREPKPGIDADAAKRHMRVIHCAWGVDYDRKVAAAAWLLTLWYDEPTDEPTDEPGLPTDPDRLRGAGDCF